MAEIEVATFEQIATLLSQLSNNYSNLAVNYYDIFYNPVPQDVTIQLYDAAGVLKDYVIPNRAKDFRFVLNGEGNPEGAISAKVGATYQDTLNGKFYIKQLGEGNKGWVEIASSEDFIKGEGSPEGFLVKDTGTMYIDTLEGILYIKTTSTGNTGWVRISYPENYYAKSNLDNLTQEGEAHFANPALSNLNSLGEAHFANPSLTNLNSIGNRVINSKENVSNKVYTIDNNSTDIQYPSAKATNTAINKAISGVASGFATTELDNLTNVGEKKLSTSKMYMTGEVSNDKRGYNQLVDMKHSTFDKTKFKIVGTPNITDDGIASGFSGGNYVNILKQLKLSKSFIIKGKFKLNNKNHEGSIFATNMGVEAFSLQQSKSGNLYIYYPDRNSERAFAISKNILDINREYNYKLSFDGINFKCNYSDDRAVYNIVDTTNVKFEDITFLNIGNSRAGNGIFFQGSIDLKQFSISVDGKEVFNGNKTGIDIIKPDNFEKVGNPVISDDGIAIFNAQGQGLKTGTNLDFQKQNIDISFNFKITKESLNRENALLRTSDSAFMLSLYTNKNDLVAFNILQNPFSVYDKLRISNLAVIEGDVLKIDLSIHKNKARLFVIKNNQQTFEKIVEDYPAQIVGECRFSQNDNRYLAGSIDLNAFKIYVDGNLVYQPCLKIPYTESKTGSKIVDSIYRDRVTDVFEQTGKALYYTLDETNKNLTLPAGEIYGMLGEGGVGNPDDVTIQVNEIKQLQAIGTLERNKQLAKYDWVGTLEEFEAQDIENKHPEWVCFITDDCNEADADKVYQIGCVVPFLVSKNYIPAGFVRTDGTEFTKGLFPDLWTDFLQPITIGTKQVVALDTCTYDEYSQDISRTGACVRWAVDTVRGTFKVPFIPDGYYFKAGQGVANKAGLPNIEGNTGNVVGYSGQVGTGAFSGRTNAGNANLTQGGLVTSSNLPFDASRSNPIYGASDTVETNAVGVRWFVRIANSKLGKSLADWSAVIDGLNGKVSKSGDTMTGNLTIKCPQQEILLDKRGQSGDKFCAINKFSGRSKQETTTEDIGIYFSHQWTHDKDGQIVSYQDINKDKHGSIIHCLGAISPNGKNWASMAIWARDDAVGAFINGKNLGAWVTETYVNGTSGYRVWSDGFCEQWGYKDTVGDVTFLKRFKDTNYNVILVKANAQNSGNFENPSHSNRRVDKFYFSWSGTTPNFGPIHWRACGYIW